MVCPDCNGELINKKIPYFFHDIIYLGDFEAEICERCNSIYFTEESSKQIELRAKLIGIWGSEAIPPKKPLITNSSGRIPITNASTIYGEKQIFPYQTDISVTVV